jgi:MEDS: MEthanogen/methylotroph, DcmR Sensory domain
VQADAHTLAVEQMRLGDHAFAHYGDDNARWQVPAVFTQRGLDRGEKVIILGDPAVPHDEAYQRMAAFGGRTEQGRARGQLVFSSMRALIHPDRSFTARRQLSRLREETARARWEGYAGLRAFIDMAWVRDLGMDVEAVMRREKSAGGLFTSRRYAEICSYDRRSFAPAVVEEMRVSHPVALLERHGELQARHSRGEVRLIGDADVLTRDRFRDAIGALLRPAPRGQALVDLSRLCFLSASCAGDLVRLVAGADGYERVVIRCSGVHARTLRYLGAARIGRLVLDELAEDR